ncbi:MAG TPA: polyprenyl synthetase family protein [Acidimicrobiales bacterium]|jgi:geranylgeranyl diphosphate synthase type I
MSPGPSDAIAAGVADLATEVDATILALLDADGVRWEKVDPQLHAPLASLRRLVMAGGKRLRPAFCYWGFRGAGGDAGDPRIVRAGAALELLHTSALIHDDVIDCSASRRGLEVIHAEFARRHADAAWPGDSERFGEGIAILLGDLAFVYADMLLAGVPAPALAVFDELRLEVNVGQLLDLIGSARRDATVESARRIGRYKSAKYTIERPLHLGAAIADPAGWGRLSGPLSDYGLPLGEAFQLKDDLLGAFGDPARTGKPAGGDIREGKPTLLYALSRQHATGSASRLIIDRFGAPDLSDREVAAIQTAFEDTGARAEVEAMVDALVTEALEAAGRMPISGEAAAALGALAHFVAGRDF